MVARCNGFRVFDEVYPVHDFSYSPEDPICGICDEYTVYLVRYVDSVCGMRCPCGIREGKLDPIGDDSFYVFRGRGIQSHYC